ncbi:hypothetical protein V1T76_08675 [Roseibium sp. FZY0029]|uniref:hypothetical protein n=1 Tax=Roseibium sp. FZY0029 TaxID=3116647 RepID=UPI002EAE7D01|nr:hypothetical protein [Roseibium sp. FZY0029]
MIFIIIGECGAKDLFDALDFFVGSFAEKSCHPIVIRVAEESFWFALEEVGKLVLPLS